MLISCTSQNLKNIRPGNNPATNTLPGVQQLQGQFPPSSRNVALNREGQIKRFREMFKKIELSASAYDTAWVAMVPSMDSSKQQPHFSNYLKWILENQQPDGSWALHPTHPLLVKDSLTSTLACVLALRKWNASQQLVHKGLDYILSNVWAATDTRQHSPIGFDIIFPGMIQHARDMNLHLPLDQSPLDAMLLKQGFDISFEGQAKHFAYVAEGLMGSHHWKEIMKYQRNDGSLFNSPSTTAAALMNSFDGRCFDYLNSMSKRFNHAVPIMYPLDIYTRLFMIDNLKKLGIDRYFNKEIERVLEDVYRCWKEGSEEIFLDTKCCAMAFRLLRQSGYEVSSDVLSGFEEQQNFIVSATENEKDTKSILELYKASMWQIFQDEHVLDNIYAWTRTHLKEKLLSGQIRDRSLHAEVDYALAYPHADLVRIEAKNYIENYNIDNFSCSKTSYRFCNVDNRSLLRFSVQDFNLHQCIHQKEIDYLEKWVKKYRIDQLEFARQTIRYAYFAIVAEMAHPDIADARAVWAQNTVLITIVDDFFDMGGNMEELHNLIALIESWDDFANIGFMSKEVEILFHAIYGTTNEQAAKAKIQQGRCIRQHLIDTWMALVKAVLREAEWTKNQIVPTMYEYLSNAYVSFALGPIVLTSMYMMGHTLSEEVAASEEYKNLYMHASLIGRLINDREGHEREKAQGKYNYVSLQVVHGRGAVTEEDAQEMLAREIESHRRALLRMVLQKEGSMVPRACKDLYWTISKDVYLFYRSGDGYSSPTKMVNYESSIICEPIMLPIN